MSIVKIKSIRKIKHASKRYDIQTSSGNFYANGILVHNSQTGVQFIDGSIDARNRNTPLLVGNMDRQYHPIPAWIQEHYEALWKLLGNDRILFGEWLFHVHTVVYDHLPDWFVGFGLFDKVAGRFVPFLEGRALMTGAGIAIVPLIETAVIRDKAQLLGYIKISVFGNEQMEGVVLHSIDDSTTVKYVTEKFKHAVDHARHWRKCDRTKNAIRV